MAEVDKNKDGVIQFEEFVEAMVKSMDKSFVDLTVMRKKLGENLKGKIKGLVD